MPIPFVTVMKYLIHTNLFFSSCGKLVAPDTANSRFAELSIPHPQNDVMETHPHEERTTDNRNDYKRSGHALFDLGKRLHAKETHQEECPPRIERGKEVIAN